MRNIKRKQQIKPENYDQTIEESERRAKGQFYTPLVFARYAMDMIERQFGTDVREKYVFYDPCCGTKNLTRDYRFKELYCSTLEQAELDIGSKYNPEAVSFQFDFLNDPLEKLPEGLKKALAEKREITFLINPPYMQNSVNAKSDHKSIVFNQMLTDKVGGKCASNLLTQFLYRIMMIKKQFGCNVNLAFFCKPIFLTGSAYKKFRELFLNEFEYKGGFLFSAMHFDDCSANWGIDFTVWRDKLAKSDGNLEHNNGMSGFEHTLIDLNNDGDIVEVGTKTIYNLDDYTPISGWTQELVAKLPKVDFPQLANAIKPEVSKWGEHKTIENALGYFYCNSNNIAESGQFTGLFSSVFKNGHGHGINTDNFSRCCSAFAARRLIKGDWINDKDQYMKPNTDDPRYPEFESDTLVFSLFDSNSQQSSLRKVEYKGKTWDVKNEFFWIPSKTMAEWADEEGLDETYAEAITSPDRHMAKVLNGTSLSEEAKAVIDRATELVRKSMKFRRMFDDDHPEYQVLNFDSSYYQVKAILKEYMPNELKEFRELYRKLADKMRPMVYELGFLKK